MKMIRQLLRQPLKSLMGITLMTLAAAIACLCVGQSLAAQTTKAALDERFSTVGIPLVQSYVDGTVDASSFLVEQEFQAWLEKMETEHPDIFRLQAHHGILSAHIPELNPMNFVEEMYFATESPWYDFQPFPENLLYTDAVLVITLQEVSQPEPVEATYPVEDLTPADFESRQEYDAWLQTLTEEERVTVTRGYTVNITGTVTQALSLAGGYWDAVGRVARLTFTAPTLEQVQALDLVIGEQYIVHGTDYMDQHWRLVSQLNPSGYRDHILLKDYNPDFFRFLSEAELNKNQAYAERWPLQFGHLKDLVADYAKIKLTMKQYLQLNAITMTLSPPVSLRAFTEIRDEVTGELLELRPQEQLTYTDFDGNTVTMSLAEYAERYAAPTIARLEGGLDAFLHSSHGAAWREILEQSKQSNQSFPILGVDKLNYLADFALQRSRIVAGRDFTEEERKNGGRVCIIHESLAEANGLTVGDTVTLNMFASDPALTYGQANAGLLLPFAAGIGSATPVLDAAEYTIVGLWRGKKLWPDIAQENEYAFSPNTVFVPQSSVQAPMEQRQSVLYYTLVLQNGKIEEFHALAVKAGYAGRFKYYDQGYSTIAANFHNYEILGKQMITIGAVLYTVLLLLFLLLYPGSRRSDMGTMQSFGAGFGRRFCHVTASSFCIAVPASLLGGWLGMQLWDYLVAALQIRFGMQLWDYGVSALQTGILPWIMLAQLLVVAILTVFVAIFVAMPRKMASRR